MNETNLFDKAIKDGNAGLAAALWGAERIFGGGVPGMVVATLVRLQREIDELKTAKE